MTYLYGYNYIAYAFLIISINNSRHLKKGHQIRFQFKKASFRLNNISTILGLTIKGYSDKC